MSIVYYLSNKRNNDSDYLSINNQYPLVMLNIFRFENASLKIPLFNYIHNI
jgi:hypothetical protein